MLNFVQKPTTKEIEIIMTLRDGKGIIYLPDSFRDQRFIPNFKGDVWTFDRVETGGKVGIKMSSGQPGHKWASSTIGDKYFSIKTFPSKKCKIIAKYDGKTFIFDRPDFEPADKPIKKEAPPKEEFSDFRGALENVNRMILKYGAKASVVDNQVTATVEI